MLIYRGEFLTVQKGNVCASAWMDRKIVSVMSTTSQPAVLRRQKDGTRLSVPCPMSIDHYNSNMGVSTGETIQGVLQLQNQMQKIL